MKRFSIWGGLLGLLLVGGCSEERELEGVIGGEDRVRITAEIVSGEASRAEIGLDGKGRFTPGDEIDLWTSTPGGSSPVRRLTLGSEGWSPELVWSDLGEGRIAFSAFYPVVGADAPTFTHSVAGDQSAETDYQRSDLLHARTESSRGESVVLGFTHLMSRLCLTLSSDGSFTDEELAAARIEILSRNGIGVQTSDGALSEVTGPEQRIIPRKVGRAFYAVLCPQRIDERWRHDKWIEITVGDKVVEYRAPAAFADGRPFGELVPGGQVTLNIELKKKAEESWANRTEWVYGVRPVPIDEWGYTDVYPAMTRGLKWAPGNGWYDCNKVDPLNQQNIDSKMCWAAASANLLYWWMEQNRAYIERYGKYTGPSRYNSSLDCEVFGFYKAKFGNVGVDVAAALDWFITGQFGMNYKPGAGFFEEVFGRSHITRIMLSDVSFNEDLKHALTNREGIECTLVYPREYHAITIWGAEFDAEGVVSAIYIADNNDRALDEQSEFVDYKGRQITQAGIIRKRVQKKSDGFYMEGSQEGSFTFKIREMNVIGLMQDRWEAYFAKQSR